MEKKKPSYTVGGSVNWYRHNGKWYAGSSKTINRITIWSRNSIPGSRKKMKIIWKDTGTIMFITALFTTAKAWEQPKCPSGDDWLKTIWNTHTHTHTHTHTPHTHTHTHTHTASLVAHWYRIHLPNRRLRFDPWIRKRKAEWKAMRDIL